MVDYLDACSDVGHRQLSLRVGSLLTVAGVPPSWTQLPALFSLSPGGWPQSKSIQEVLMRLNKLGSDGRLQSHKIKCKTFLKIKKKEKKRNPNTHEVKIGETRVPGHPWVHSQFEANLGYLRPCVTKKQTWKHTHTFVKTKIKTPKMKTLAQSFYLKLKECWARCRTAFFPHLGGWWKRIPSPWSAWAT